jgi:hypothetical protein
MGLVKTYQAGKTIVINSTQGPVSFGLSASTQVVNAAGKAVTAQVNPGQRVDVYYTGTGTNRLAERVVVQDWAKNSSQAQSRGFMYTRRLFVSLRETSERTMLRETATES